MDQFKDNIFDFLDSDCTDIESLKRSNTDLRALIKFSITVSSLNTIDEILQYLVNHVIEVMNVQDCVIYLRNSADAYEQKFNYKKNSENNTPLKSIIISSGQGIVGASAESMTPILVEDTLSDPRYIQDGVVSGSELAIPLIVNREIYGVIDLENSKKKFFTTEHQNMLLTLARIIAERLEKKILDEAFVNSNEEILRIKNEQRALILIAKAAFKSERSEEFYSAIHKIITKLLHITSFQIALMSNSEKQLRFPYYYDEDSGGHIKVVINEEKFEQSLTVRCIRSSKPLLLQNEKLKSYQSNNKTLVYGALPNSYLAVPFVTPDGQKGAVILQSYTGQRVFNKSDIKLSAFISNHISIALQRQQKIDLNRVGRQIMASINLTNVIDLVYAYVNELFEIDVFRILICDKNKTQLSLYNKEKGLTFPVSSLPFDKERSLASHCIEYDKEIILKQLSETINYVKQAAASVGESMQSHVFLPLKHQDNIIGCMSIQRSLTGGYSEREVNIMRTIAKYTAVAVENASTHEQLKQASRTDMLTQLLNRRAFLDKAEFQKKVFNRNKASCCFAIADIDNFKRFNDTYGHEGGDFVLKEVAKLFTDVLRSQDLVARWGGEEFVFMLPNTDDCSAKKVLELIRTKLASSSFLYKEQQLSVTATFGICILDNNDSVDQVIDKADKALYYGKKHGKNQVVNFNSLK